MTMKSIKIMLAGLMMIPMLALSVGLIAPMNVFAESKTACDPADLTAAGGANCGQGTGTETNLFGTDGVFTIIINTALFIIGAISVMMLIYGGIRYTTSGGNEKSVTAAKNTILYAVVGIIIALLAYAIVNFVLTTLTAS